MSEAASSTSSTVDISFLKGPICEGWAEERVATSSLSMSPLLRMPVSSVPG